MRRIHGMAATDPEIASIVRSRNDRRVGIAARLIERMGGPQKQVRAARLVGLTSFEVYDALAETLSQDEVVRVITGITREMISATSSHP